MFSFVFGFSSLPFHFTEVHFLTRDQQPFSKTERASIWDMRGDVDYNTSNQQCPIMKADVETAKLMEVTCAELRGVTLEDLEEGKDYNQNILYENFLNNCLKINFL